MGKKAYIIGMGPAGMASALSLLSSGYSVVLIDRRTEEDLFERKQGVLLQDDTIKDFFSLSQLAAKGYSLEFKDDFYCQLIRPHNANLVLSAEERLDLSFFELIEKERTVIPIGSLQLYQYNKLKYIYNQGGYTFQNKEEAPSTVKFNTLKQELTFHLGDANIIQVDAKEQELTLDINGTVQQHHFDLLVDASGKTSKSFTQLWNSQNPEFAITYEPVDNPHHNAFGIMCASIKNVPLAMIASPLLTPLNPVSFVPLEKIGALNNLGWNCKRPPLFFLKYSKEQETVYLIGEIPEHILNGNQEQNLKEKELKEWFDLMMKLIFKNKHFKTKFPDLASVFSLNIEIADKFALVLPNGGAYCLVGDALMPANFLFGHGIYNALQDANELFDQIEDGFFRSKEYRDSRLNNYRQEMTITDELILSKVESLQLEDELQTRYSSAGCLEL